MAPREVEFDTAALNGTVFFKLYHLPYFMIISMFLLAVCHTNIFGDIFYSVGEV